jgi:nuclear transport factor 2 (NTF2) superfamily protein
MSFQLPPIAKCTEILDLRHCLRPLGQEVALQKLRVPEDWWNTHNRLRIPHAYASNGDWQPHAEFVPAQLEMVAFLIRAWTKELGYRLMKELSTGAKIAVCFAYEWSDSASNWIRSLQKTNWALDAGPTKRRLACISDSPMGKPDRMMRWGRSGPRAAHHSGTFHFSSLTIGELKSRRRPE